jgi:hypothetical protein
MAEISSDDHLEDISELDAWKRRALSLELTEQYLREKLHIKEVQLEAIKRSPAWKLSKPLRVLNLIVWKFRPDLKNIPELEVSATLNTTGETVVQQVSKVAFFEVLNCNLNDTEKRYAFVASYLVSPQISESLQSTIKNLVDQGFTTVLIAASGFQEPLVVSSELKTSVSIIRKPNLGYDFGSWAVANAMVPNARHSREVLLINDSLYFNNNNSYQFAATVRKATESSFDVTSVTDSLLHSYHLQSYFLHFKNGAFGHKEVQRFMNQVRPQQDRDAVIFAYEIGFSLLARKYGITIGATHPWNSFKGDQGNASIHSWRELMNMGWPFIKKEVFKSKSKSECEHILKSLVNESNFSTQIIDAVRSDLGIA